MSDALVISCPRCRRKLRLRAEYLGKKLHCTSCDHVFRAIPEEPAEAPVQELVVEASPPAAETAPAPPPTASEPGPQVIELQLRLHETESAQAVLQANHARSEERRVGKECRPRGGPWQYRHTVE